MLLNQGLVDGALVGGGGDWWKHFTYALPVIPRRADVDRVYGLSVLILPRGTVFICDTHVNVDPTPEQITEATLLAAEAVRNFGLVPQAALLSHSSFGSSNSPAARKMRLALALIRARDPDLVVDGEMHGDAALSPTVRGRYVGESPLTGTANLLVMPSLDAANIAMTLLHAATDALQIGPILLGLSKPLHVLTPTVTARGIVNMTALAGQRAGRRTMSLDGKVALVTGAGSGIGRAAALALHRAGSAVVLAGRRADALEETSALAGGGADRLLIASADVSDPQSVAGLFEAAADRFGRLDVLFNNAGTGAPPVPFEDLSIEAWRRVVDVNLTGAFLCTQAAFRVMKAQSPQGGRIINNGSISAHSPRPRSAAYTATKHAITGLTKSTSLDGRPYDIACGQIDIGNAATPMTQAMARGVPQADGSLAPEPVMDVEAVADAVVFMAGLPLEANVQFMTVMATKMPFIGRG